MAGKKRRTSAQSILAMSFKLGRNSKELFLMISGPEVSYIERLGQTKGRRNPAGDLLYCIRSPVIGFRAKKKT